MRDLQISVKIAFLNAMLLIEIMNPLHCIQRFYQFTASLECYIFISPPSGLCIIKAGMWLGMEKVRIQTLRSSFYVQQTSSLSHL